MFVCTGAACYEYADDIDAVAAALAFAARHERVGIDTDEPGAFRAAARALPGMVVCRRDARFPARCCPLTATTALVLPPLAS